MNKTAEKTQNRNRRRARIRARISGTAVRPRLVVFKSNTALYAQLIDDERGVTLASADSRKHKGTSARERARAIGAAIAADAKQKGVEKVVFDRGGFQYEGVIAALADGAREAGLVF